MCGKKEGRKEGIKRAAPPYSHLMESIPAMLLPSRETTGRCRMLALVMMAGWGVVRVAWRR